MPEPRHRDGPPYALLAGGGSGGHVFPALAVGAELSARGWRVGLAGRASGMEERLADRRGVEFHALPARPVVGRSPAARALAAGTLVVSALRARGLIRRLAARVVFATGGYVCAPAVLGARLAGRPAMLLEPNARAGTANRWLARSAAEAAVAYAETVGDLRCPAVHTGVPVRADFFQVPTDLPSGTPRVLVLGGSQGARQLNELMPVAVRRLAREGVGIAVLHQAGRRHVDATRGAYRRHAPGAEVEVVAFLEDVAGAMAGCHLVISRAGAVTLAEICAAGRPALLVPLTLAGGHQGHNAAALEAAGGARVLPAVDLGADELASALGRLISDRPRLEAMAAAARGLARPGAAAAIADRLEALGSGSSGIADAGGRG